MSTEIEHAMNTLKNAIKNDPSYAYSWHANIAMACYEALTEYREISTVSHETVHTASNDAASRFMKICFDANTSHNMLKV